MRAIVQTQHAEDFAAGLQLVDDHPLPEPDAAKKLVRVRVAYAASNPIDYKFLRGDLAALIKMPFPCPTGRDFSGVVDALPEGLENPAGIKVGDRVCGYLGPDSADQGSCAEFLLAPIASLAVVPEGVALRDAAGLALAGITTYVALVEKLHFTPGCGKKILILGGSSATGMLALQLARELGCAEIACTSTSAELCTSLGATRVIDYRHESWWKVLEGGHFDAVYDTVGGSESYEASGIVLKKKGGTFYTIVGDVTSGKLTIGVMLGAMCASLCRGCCSGPKYVMGMNLPTSADHGLTYWLDLLAAKRAKVVIDPSGPYDFNADGAAAMLTKQASGRSKGKLVMAIGGDTVDEASIPPREAFPNQ